MTDALDTAGWLWHHHPDSRLDHGTPGLPDLVAVHPRTGRVVWLEVKTAKGRVAPDQEAWAAALRQGGHEHRVVRPDGMALVVDDLLAERRRTRSRNAGN